MTKTHKNIISEFNKSRRPSVGSSVTSRRFARTSQSSDNKRSIRIKRQITTEVADAADIAAQRKIFRNKTIFFEKTWKGHLKKNLHNWEKAAKK